MAIWESTVVEWILLFEEFVSEVDVVFDVQEKWSAEDMLILVLSLNDEEIIVGLEPMCDIAELIRFRFLSGLAIQESHRRRIQNQSVFKCLRVLIHTISDFQLQS